MRDNRVRQLIKSMAQSPKKAKGLLPAHLKRNAERWHRIAKQAISDDPDLSKSTLRDVGHMFSRVLPHPKGPSIKNPFDLLIGEEAMGFDIFMPCGRSSSRSYSSRGS